MARPRRRRRSSAGTRIWIGRSSCCRRPGFADGFEFKLSYGDAAVSGLSYAVLAQKLQSDLARVGIKVTLDPIDQVNLRTQYTTGKSTGGVLTFWNPSGVETDQWAQASVQRVAKRIHWTPDPVLMKTVDDAGRRSRTPPSAPRSIWNTRRR